MQSNGCRIEADGGLSCQTALRTEEQRGGDIEQWALELTRFRAAGLLGGPQLLSVSGSGVLRADSFLWLRVPPNLARLVTANSDNPQFFPGLRHVGRSEPTGIDVGPCPAFA